MSGFQNAGITKGLILLTGVSSLVVSLADLKPYAHLQLVPHITKHKQIWRLSTYQLAFTNSPELLMAVMTMYHMGVTVERYFGSRKHASFLFLIVIFSTMLSFAALLVLQPLVGFNYIPAGSFALQGAIVYQYLRLVPAIYTFRVFGIDCSSKLFMSIFPCFLVYLQLPHTLFPFLLGIFLSAFYSSNLTLPLPYLRSQPISSFRLPKPLFVLLQRTLFPLVGESLPPRRADRIIPDEVTPGMRAQQASEAAAREVEAAAAALAETLARRGVLVNSLREAEAELARLPVDSSTTATTAATAGPGSEPAASTATTAANSPTASIRNLPGAGRATRMGLGGLLNSVTGLRADSPGPEQGGETVADAPTEENIQDILNMFPNLSRQRVVDVLQRSNHNTALAVEMLLDEAH